MEKTSENEYAQWETEFLMEEQKRVSALGGTMRLGAYPCKLKKDTLAYEIYKIAFEEKNLKDIFRAKKDIIYERHRHRYEFNTAYKDILEKYGLIFSGICPDNNLVEIIELSKKEHPFFIGVQFHPEFKSKPLAPHPLFSAFVKAARERKILRMNL
jgi:CTP synthase